jgi:hypothetical protein
MDDVWNYQSYTRYYYAIAVDVEWNFILHFILPVLEKVLLMSFI